MYRISGKISVKTPLSGCSLRDEFAAILDIYNRYPLSEVIIHARVQKDFYTGKPDGDAFRQALAVCRHPVCYNGDLFTVADYQQFCQAFPDVQRVMLGRGWITNPDPRQPDPRQSDAGQNAPARLPRRAVCRLSGRAVR